MAKCPYCKMNVTLKDLKKEKQGFAILIQETMYSCPHCESILGIGRGKYG